MKSQTRWLIRLLASILPVMAIVFCFARIAHVQQNSFKVSTSTKQGMYTTTFDTVYGRVIVNLPDDMAAGDTISGTVVVDPKGITEEGQSTNADMLDGCDLEIQGTPILCSNGNFQIVVPAKNSASNRPQTVTVRFRDKKQEPGEALAAVLPVAASAAMRAINEGTAVEALPSPSPTPTPTPTPPKMPPPPGATVEASANPAQGAAPLRVDPPSNTSDTPPATPPSQDFRLPSMGQEGRNGFVIGRLDGKFSTTDLTIAGQSVRKLTESPRKVVFRIPVGVTGLTEIVFREGNVEVRGPYRNIGVRLSAPKTNLLKGESTTLTVKVAGLQGIKEDVPLHLDNASPAVVRMHGGDKQTFRITPATLQPDGTFSTTRAITGQQAGSFSVTATVVVFNDCLQDDSEPARVLLWNTFTGDYIFCSGPISGAGANPISRSTMDFSGGVSLQTGDTLDTYKSGTFTSADFNYARGRIHLEVDDYTHTGTATVQTMNPQQTFTIKDRDTRNNTCTCMPKASDSGRLEVILTKDAKVNGYTLVETSSGSYRFQARNIINPVTGQPLEALHKLLLACEPSTEQRKLSEEDRKKLTQLVFETGDSKPIEVKFVGASDAGPVKFDARCTFVLDFTAHL